MQNRGAIIFLAVLFALVCLFHLSFTYFTSRVEKKARQYAQAEVTSKLAKEMSKGNQLLEAYYIDSISKSRETYFLDSMSNQVIYNFLWIRKYSYMDCKEREINLGLDLKGGMNVTLEISVGEIIKGLARNNQDPVFQKAIKMAYEKQKNSQKDFVDLFAETLNEIDPKFPLAKIFLLEFKDKGITMSTPNDEVVSMIREETKGAIDRTFNILRTRIDRFGVTQPNIQKLPTSGRILVELPGIKDPERVRKLLQGSAKLEFWETYKYNEVYQYFIAANEKLKNISEGIDTTAVAADSLKAVADTTKAEVDKKDAKTETKNDSVKADTGKVSSLLKELEKDTAKTKKQDESFAEYAKKNPLNAYLQPALFQQQGQYYPGQTSTVGYAQVKDTARINRMLRQTKNIFPRDMHLKWAIKSREEGTNVLELYALKSTTREGSAALGGDVIVNARQDYDQNGGVEVSMSMNSEGTRTWKRLTGENVGNQIAIVLDDFVYSAPNVNGEIPNGQSSITGGFTVEEGQDLANVLKAGKLPAPARIVEEAVVGPSLGKEAIQKGVWSFIIAFILVLVYMGLYYNHAGWIANIALFGNIFFIFGILASFGAVLTLPGIAGIVLTLGMAVDANVIIYERIREEVRTGKGIRLAISDGYKHAYSAIIDGNATTLITAIILFVFGSGPVQGFATTLIIGILSSLFTAIFISRIIFNWVLSRNMNILFGNRITNNTLVGINFDFIGFRKKGYLISSIIIGIGVISLFLQGLNYGVDFSGGRTYVVRFDQKVNTSKISAALTKTLVDESNKKYPVEVKTFGPDKQVKITTKYLIDDNSPQVDSIIQVRLFTALKPFYKDQSITINDFTSDTRSQNKLVGILSSQTVGPTIADDIKMKAVLAIVFSLLGIFIYIAIRFKKWQFGLGGLISLAHDAMIAIGLYSLLYNIMPFNMEVDQAFIAAILTIIGYSINDTVIIFDRIREYNKLYPKHELRKNMNDAMNSTLGRTLNTAGTTIIVLLAIFIFGGEAIRGFIFALLIGILTGTYSSILNAAPIAYDLLRRGKAKEQAVKTVKAE